MAWRSGTKTGGQHLTLALGIVAAPAVAARAQVPDSAREQRFWSFLSYGTLVRGGTVAPHWMADGSSFWHAVGGPDSTVLVRVDPAKNETRPLLDLARARRAVASILGHEPAYRGLPFEEVSLSSGETTVRFTVEGRELSLDLASYAVSQLPSMTAAERARFVPQVISGGKYGGDPDLREVLSPDRRWFARDQGNDIWLRSTTDGRLERLTTGGTPDFPWSIAVNSEEGESPSTALWSPDGLRLAVMKEDRRAVRRIPIAHWLKPLEEIEWRPYVKAGGPMPVDQLYVIDVPGKRAVRVEVDAVDHYVVPAAWLPDGSELLFYRFRRDYQVLELLAASPRTGAARLVLRETSATFIKGIGSDPQWMQLLTLLPDGKRFLWHSERDGWGHLYLYGIDGALIGRVTKGAFPVKDVEAVGTDGWVYLTANAEPRVLDTHVYRVRLDGSGFARLTDAPGMHAPVFSPSTRFFLDTHSSIDRPPSVDLRSADGTFVRTLSRGTIDSLAGLGWKAPEPFVVKAADGTTDLHGVMVKPPGFDPARKYPVVEYIYGGPQLVNTPRTFTQAALQQAYAQLGFVTITLDARGTPERGKAFQDVVYKSFGRNEIPDHAAAIRQLGARHSFLDLSRVGIFGGSWGGYMTVRAMVLAPDTYQVGVARYPVVDLIDHWNLIEGYMGLPQQHPAEYEYGSSLRLAGNLKGKLLLTHGTSDVNATFSATMKMVDALTRAGKPYDLAVFPEESHAFSPGANRYWNEITKNYFVKHLRP